MNWSILNFLMLLLLLIVLLLQAGAFVYFVLAPLKTTKTNIDALTAKADTLTTKANTTLDETVTDICNYKIVSPFSPTTYIFDGKKNLPTVCKTS